MKFIWFCLECGHLGPLTKHGRCECCDSNAVDIPVRTPSVLAFPEGKREQIAEANERSEA